MRTRVRALIALPTFMLTVTQACPRWPAWTEEFASQLKCGMSPSEIRALTPEKVEILEAGSHPWLGRHFVRNDKTELWMQFDSDERLRSIVLSGPDGWRIMSRRLSPRKNLCTGELTFIVRVNWTYEMEGAELYLDGRPVTEGDWADTGNLLIVPVGTHELRFEKEGFHPVIKRLELTSEAGGEQRLDFQEEELQPRRSPMEEQGI